MNIQNIYNKTISDLNKSKLSIENVFTIGYLAACKDNSLLEINKKQRYDTYTSELKLNNQLQLKKLLIRDFNIENYPISQPIIVNRKKYSYTISDIDDIRKIRKYRENKDSRKPKDSRKTKR